MRERDRRAARYEDTGVALILVLLALFVLTTLAAAMIFSARSEIFSSYNYRLSEQASFAARAGIQRGLNFFNSSNVLYVPVPFTQASTYYDVSTYANKPTNLLYSNATPVNCRSACTGGTGAVVLGLINADGTVSNRYPPTSATNNVNVITNWTNNMMNQTISDGLGGSGTYTVTATLLEYHTVNDALFGSAASDPACTADPNYKAGLCRLPYEVWRVESTGTWNGNVAGGAPVATAKIIATIAPMYVPYFGNALYGLCSVTMSGNVCTDSYDSSVGSYGGSNANNCASVSSTSNNASATNAGVGSNGGVKLNGLSLSIGGNLTFANATGNAACDTGFQGSDSGVKGSVLPGPPIPAPPPIDMTAWGYPNSSPVVSPQSGGTVSVANVIVNATAPPKPPYGYTLTWTSSGTQPFAGTFAAGTPLPVGKLSVTTGSVTGTDTGIGTINGTGITSSSSTVNYKTGAITVTFTAAPASSCNVQARSGSGGSAVTITLSPSPNGTVTTFTGTFTGTSPIPGAVSVTNGCSGASRMTGNDNGSSPLTGSGIAAGSFIDYSTGGISVSFTTVPTSGTTVTACICLCPSGSSGYVEKYTVSISGSNDTYGNYSCTALTGSGTSSNPYRLGDVNVGGSAAGFVNIINPTTSNNVIATSPIRGLDNPIYIATNSVSVGNNGVFSILTAPPDDSVSTNYSPSSTSSPPPNLPTSSTASAYVLDVYNSVNMTGGVSQLNSNYVPPQGFNPASGTPGVPSPEYLTINILGSGTALDMSGQAQISAMISAPNGTASLSGSGNSGAIFGSILANKIADSGGYSLHYDLSARMASGKLYSPQVVSVSRPVY